MVSFLFFKQFEAEFLDCQFLKWWPHLYWPGGVVRHVDWRQGSRLGAQDRTERTAMTLHTPPVSHGPRGSLVQVDSIIAECASSA